jgi:hypothetical protein
MPGTRASQRLLAAGLLVALGLSYWRLYYGVDFTDEAWYVAVPYRFVLGGKPYVDELSVPQTTAGVLLYPFVWAYHALVGRSGIVLFVRHVHFLVALAIGASVSVALRRVAGATTAFLAGLAAFSFVPFAIPSVSYDSLGSGLFTAGTLLGFLSLARPRARPWAGLCLGLAAFSYPPLILGVVASCALRLFVNRRQPRGELVISAIALAVPVAGFALLAAVAGPHQIISDYRRSSHYLGQAGGLTKLHGIAAHLKDTFPLWYLAAAGLLLLAWSWARGWKRLAAVVLVLLPLTGLSQHPRSYTASLDFVAHAGWLALPLLYALRRRQEAVELFVAVWIPALVGGLVTAYSSANGGVNFGVGFFPAVVVSLVFATWSLQELGEREALPASSAALLLALVVFVIDVVPVYRDAQLLKLNTMISSGPYAGLVTNRPKAVFLDDLNRDLASVGASCRISFFVDFPAGYLLTPAQPDTSAVWTATVSRRLTNAYHDDLIRYWVTHGYPDVIVLMHRIPFALPASARIESYTSTDPLLVVLHTHDYRRTADRLDYSVYRRDSCS